MNQKLFLLLWVAIFALASNTGLAQQTTGPGYGVHMWDGGWHGWFFGPAMMIVFIAFAVVIVVLLVRWLGGAPHNPSHHPYAAMKTPLDILKERFAKGEIDKEEFDERRRVLGE